MGAKKVIAVVGPTGSGKTALAVKLAKKYNGVILSADSRQVYRGLDIGTNKEGVSGQWHHQPARYIDQIPQLFIDIAKPGDRFTLANWLELANQALAVVWQNHQLPIIVGGTGLYVTALLEGYRLTSENSVRRHQLEKLSKTELQQRVQKKNIKLNESDSQNPRRLIRALERFESGQASYQGRVAFESLVLYLDQPLAGLYDKSDQRARRLFDNIVIETRDLITNGVSPDWLNDIGLDYRCASRYLTNSLPQEEAIAQLQRDSRRYIRRQTTWWRKRRKVTITTDTQAVEAVSNFLKDR